MAQYGYGTQLVIIASLPAVFLFVMFWTATLAEGITMTRIARGTLDHGVLPNPVDTMGLASLVARCYPQWLPCERLGDTLDAVFKLLGLDQAGSVVTLQFGIYDLLAPTILSTAVRMFDCEVYDGGSRSLRADLSVDCDGDAHKGMQVFSVLVMMCYGLVCPIITVAALWPMRDRIDPPVDNELAALNTRATDSSLDAIRIVFRAYRPRWWGVSKPQLSR